MVQPNRLPEARALTTLREFFELIKELALNGRLPPERQLSADLGRDSGAACVKLWRCWRLRGKSGVMSVEALFLGRARL